MIGAASWRWGPRQRSVKLALPVEGDRALGRVDELDLVGLPRASKIRRASSRSTSTALPGAALGDLPADLLLEPREGLLADRLRELEVVVEAVLDRRADRHLRPRVEPPGGLGEQVGRRVAEHGEGVGVVPVPGREDLDSRRRRKRQTQVLDRCRRPARARPARRASARSLGPRRGRSRRRRARAPPRREGSPSSGRAYRARRAPAAYATREGRRRGVSHRRSPHIGQTGGGGSTATP